MLQSSCLPMFVYFHMTICRIRAFSLSNAVGQLQSYRCYICVISGVNASSRLGGRITEWGGVLEGNTPPHTGLRLSERRATNIGLLYPKVCNNIGGIFPLTSPQPKYWGMSPASPAGLTPVCVMDSILQNNTQELAEQTHRML